jgi:hypothetical protein
MSFGKSGGTTVQTPEMTPEQRAQIQAQTEFFTGTIAPTYQQAVEGATGLYNQGAPGVTRAAQNLAGTAAQVGQTTGEVGESALRTGVAGLQSLFSPDYERQQLDAAMAPAQAQYQQNIANQNAMFGGTGNMGSARQALADRQLAGQAQSLQAQTAAQIQQNIANQRAGVGAQLAGIGSGGLGQALQGAQASVAASGIPMDKFAQLACIYMGVPSQSYNPNFSGTQGSTQTGNKFGISI